MPALPVSDEKPDGKASFVVGFVWLLPVVGFVWLLPVVAAIRSDGAAMVPAATAAVPVLMNLRLSIPVYVVV